MKWRLIKQALCPLKALSPHKAALLNPVSLRVYKPHGGKNREKCRDMKKKKLVCVIREN